ncbi:unnamed protein product, partial [Prorocentrum cordatum]
GAMWGVRARGSRQRGRSMKRPPGSDEVDGERRGRVARGGALKDLSPQGGCTALHSPTKLAMAISARIAMFGANESPSRASVRTVLVPPVAASAPGRLPPRCAHGARQNSWTKKKHSPSN